MRQSKRVAIAVYSEADDGESMSLLRVVESWRVPTRALGAFYMLMTLTMWLQLQLHHRRPTRGAKAPEGIKKTEKKKKADMGGREPVKSRRSMHGS